MPMFETKVPCPICEKPLTDVDGMLECQNDDDWHFAWCPGFIAQMNFDEWATHRLGSNR